MKVDLAASTEQASQISTDICVIGAGAAGIYLASLLSRKGQNVVLLESGGRAGEGSEAAGFEVQFARESYAGATAGRYFGLGGSTSRWGGQLVPHTSLDLRDIPTKADSWPHIVQTVAANGDEVLKNLGWPYGMDHQSDAVQRLGYVSNGLQKAGIQVTSGLMLPFHLKNMSGLLNKPSSVSNLQVYYHATVSSWGLFTTESGKNSVRSVTAIAPNQNRVVVSATKFVVAAGALESARILMEIDLSLPKGALTKGVAVGKYLSDHLSISIADVASKDIDKAINLFSPSFARGWLRNYRFCEVTRESNRPRAFGHFVFSNCNPGFDLAKELLGALQARRLPDFSETPVTAGVSGLFRLGYERYVHSRLYVPRGAPCHLQLDIEQEPVSDNRVCLADDRDVYGRRKLVVDWQIREADISNIVSCATRILAKWPGKAGDLPDLVARKFGDGREKPHDAYHPAGTCRMGEEPDSVVDKDLKVYGLSNLWVVSTGVLPSAGTANPTFSMLCLAHQLVNHFIAKN